MSDLVGNSDHRFSHDATPLVASHNNISVLNVTVVKMSAMTKERHWDVCLRKTLQPRHQPGLINIRFECQSKGYSRSSREGWS